MDRFDKLKATLQSYSPISDQIWSAFSKILSLKTYQKEQWIYKEGEIPCTFAFVTRGLVRLVSTNSDGQEYNKRFFTEGEFPGVMHALHRNEPARHGIQALEDCELVLIDFKQYRELMLENIELLRLQVHYLEKNWLLEKDQREIYLVQQDARQRYLTFLKEQPELAKRVPQYHLASHLAVTATQLSRVRKQLKNEGIFT